MKSIAKFENYCKINTQYCNIPNKMVRFLINNELLFCCVESSLSKMPNILAIYYYYDFESCSLNFLIEKESVIAKNIDENPNVTFTADYIHPKSPFHNTGVMINTKANLINKEEIVSEIFANLVKKYSSLLMEDYIQDSLKKFDLIVQAKIYKMIYWQGPFFKRFHCSARTNIE